MLYQLSYSRTRVRFRGERRIRTSEGNASRFTVCPLWPLGYLPERCPFDLVLDRLELAKGIEPLTSRLQGGCSTFELRQRGPPRKRGILPATIKKVKQALRETPRTFDTSPARTAFLPTKFSRNEAACQGASKAVTASKFLT